VNERPTRHPWVGSAKGLDPRTREPLPLATQCTFGGGDDEVGDLIWPRHHADVTGTQLEYGSAHAACEQVLSLGGDDLVVGGYDVPGRVGIEMEMRHAGAAQGRRPASQ